jgi:fumarate reductase flavoprotein subunit
MAGVFSFYEGMGEAMIAAVEKKAQAVGVEILVETPATEILTDGGKVIGVRAEDAGAKLIDFQAQAVILATAGFAEDEELFQSVNNWTADKYTYKGLPGHTGDGLKMAVAAGMTMARSVTPMMIGLGVRSLGLGSVLSAAGTMEPTNVWVNQDGVRFAFEDGNVHNYAIKTQHEAFSLLDSAALDRFESAGLIYGLAAYVPRGVPAPDIRSELNKELGSGNPDIFSADSIEELARAIGVDPAQLTKTIDTYNGYCDIGADPEYGKAPDFLARIEQGPFYAFRPTVNFLVTMGGIQVNSQMQVVNEEYQPIEGLYAAGMECGGFFGEVYPAEVGGGSGQAIALATGRISGRNAAEFAK